MNYKLTVYPDIDNSSVSYLVFTFQTKAELRVARDTTAQLLLFLQDKLQIMPDSSNMFISEELINGEWEEF